MGTRLFAQDRARLKLSRMDDHWGLSDDGSGLLCHLMFDDFAHAFEIVSMLTELAEQIGHHPDISFGWGYCDISLTTHDAGGLTEKDFEFAQQFDDILAKGTLEYRD